jgi:hypothetical protein
MRGMDVWTMTGSVLRAACSIWAWASTSNVCLTLYTRHFVVLGRELV